MKLIGDVYLHVGNSGALLRVVDDGNGPELHVETSAFGNLNQVTKIKTEKAAFVYLARLFSKAMEHDFSPEYVHAAHIRDDDNRPLVGTGG